MSNRVPEKVLKYKQADAPLPDHNQLWPLYGAGLEKLGRDGQPIQVPMPQYGPTELLVRHDACGLCFSDIKVIKLGEDHPRIFRRMRENPVVLGHEVTMTVVGVGESLRDQYHVGDRFIVQADIFVDGVNYAYGYEIQGGLSQYSVIDQRILDGDDGNYLLPVQPNTGYAEAALTEPWACVIAAYELEYRTGLKPGGTTWIIGSAASMQEEAAKAEPYTISAGLSASAHPDRLLLTNVPSEFAAWLRGRAAVLGIEVLETDDLHTPPVTPVDDIILLGADPRLVETVSPHLADSGIVALIAGSPMPRPVAIDIGRIHYNGWVYVGGPGPDIAQAYHRVPVRSTLKAGGQAWFVGAGGPMGRMHVQRAIQSHQAPATIVCTDVSDLRLDDLCTSFGAEAQARGIEWICLNPTHKEEYAAGMARFRQQLFDDIVVLAPIPAVITDAATYLAPKGVMNIFAGVARGTMADLDLSDAYLRDVRVIGHSASTITDLRLMLTQAETGLLSPNRSVAAIGSLSAVRDGLEAVLDTTFPGKVVIFPNIKEMPLTALSALREAMPTVYARLKDGREWTVEAEQEFLRLVLP
jgi:threonine dehydrogenase-like Zn-dependent dehydrogenase